MLKKRYLWLILIIILALTLSLYFIYNGKNKSSVQTKEVIEETEEDIVVQEAPVKIEKGTVAGIKQGKKEWEIEADKISLGEDRKKTIFEQINRATIFKENKPHLQVQLNQCIADMESNSMELIGDVVIKSEEGDILKGDRFFWDSKNEKLTSIEPVEVIAKENRIIANQFSTDIELNNLEFNGNVNVTIKLKGALKVNDRL
ncbi:MAG: LPS export ABC transporter periplasmic protein LptC [Candidatus Infernicultor aquiphilus]|uniref:LPS export ABC transporter periplasmic protein LptC n=1 Tax=Candidatus Infernicultor aquiphilus TaxID=1805029 RepID=A0A2M7PQ23_9BACT|nr:MAG: LPS export ABC transporter periplasmic protein LptC [Candidatus Atribacteria bacterium CG_4_10_14_3_um_filter_34_13]